MRKIGIVGTGLMGTPVALRLQKQGFDVSAWNRSREKMQLLEEAGVTCCESLEDLLERVDTVLLFLASAEAIDAVIFDAEGLALAGKTLIQMGTIAPEESKSFLHKARDKGAAWLEAPVLGSIPEAKSGTLLLMVGAEPEEFTAAEGIFNALGKNPVLVGEVGKAAALKLAMNQLIAGLTATFSLSLGMVQRYGVDVETFMGITRESALYAPTFDKKLAKMLNDDFENPNFPLKHLGKDVNLFVQAAKPLGLDTRMLEGVAQQIEKGLASGDAELDYSAIFRAITSS